MKKTLVLGLGNILLGDEGVGVRVVERLQELYQFPPEVQVLDGGTLALDLLPYVEDTDRLLVVDALEMGAEPGTIARLEGDEVPAFLSLKISPHEMGLVDVLAAARLRDSYPGELVLWGVQPGVMSVGLELSSPVVAQVEVLVDKVLAELRRWGVEPTRKRCGDLSYVCHSESQTRRRESKRKGQTRGNSFGARETGRGETRAGDCREVNQAQLDTER